MASISIRCPSCSATEGVVRNGKSSISIRCPSCSATEGVVRNGK
ncbi:IS1 family transposase, partial [Escherichia coli]